MNLYIAIHRHGHGIDTHLFKADWFPAPEEIVDALGIDFEPHKDETLEVELCFGKDKLPVLEKAVVLKTSEDSTNPSLPLGTKVISYNGEEDHGSMSWDRSDHEVHRRTGPNAEGVIVCKDYSEQESTWAYDVFFPASEVCVVLYSHEINSPAYRILDHGDDTTPSFAQSNPYRDPYVVAQVEKFNALEQ